MRPDGGRVGVVDVLHDAWVLGDTVWQGGGTLILQMPMAAHALIEFWDDENHHLDSWHLNLQAPRWIVMSATPRRPTEFPVPFLLKPFEFDELLALIARLLAA